MAKSIDEHLFGDDRHEIVADDWDDQDLLTKDEAGQRLEATIRATEAELEQARVSAPQRVPQLELFLRRAHAALGLYGNGEAGETK